MAGGQAVWPATLRRDGAFLAPGRFTSRDITFTSAAPTGIIGPLQTRTVLAPTHFEETAKKLWVENLVSYGEVVDARLAEIEKSEAVFRVPMSRERVIWTIGSFAFIILTGTLFLNLVNLSVLGVAYLQRRLRERLWRPERLA